MIENFWLIILSVWVTLLCELLSKGSGLGIAIGLTIIFIYQLINTKIYKHQELNNRRKNGH